MYTFEDLKKLSFTEPVVNNCLTNLELGFMTQEQALVAMVLTLVEQKNLIQNNYTNHLNNCTMPTIVPERMD